MRADGTDHRQLTLWAADCAERVLHLFEKHRPDDGRARDALDAARAWVRGETTVAAVRVAASAAQAAGRAADEPGARAAARAAGHAAATAYAARHAVRAAKYAVTAASTTDVGEPAVASGGTVAAASVRTAAVAVEERDWQRSQLPEPLRSRMMPDR